MSNKNIPLFLPFLLLAVSSCSQGKISTRWGKEVDSFVTENIGNVALPFIESDSFEMKGTTDSFGDPLLCLYCFYSTDEAAEAACSSYYSVCGNDGYVMDSALNWGFDSETYEYFEYSTNFADKIIAENLGLEIQFLTSTYKNSPCLGIFAYPYIYEEEDVYPSVAVEHYLGEELAALVPPVTGEGYVYAFVFAEDYYGDTYLEIQVTGPDMDYEETYFNACRAAGFLLTDPYQEENLTEYPGYLAYDYYYAIDASARFGIAFNYDYSGGYFDLQIFLA